MKCECAADLGITYKGLRLEFLEGRNPKQPVGAVCDA